MARVDLRQPPGSMEIAIGVPTLGTQHELSAALDRLGARRDTLPTQLHGPWRWVLAPSTVAWLPPESRHPASGRSFLVLHDSEHLPAPGGVPIVAGRFRIHVFDDRFVSDRSSPGAGALAGEGPAIVQLVVAPGEVARLRSDGGSRPLEATIGPAGFGVASARVDRAGTIAFDVVRESAGSALVRAEADVYAFSLDR